jgi:hypothetical protein
MYVVTIITPANDNPKKKVKTYYCKETMYAGNKCIEWDEDIKYAKRFTDKREALRVRSKLRSLKGSEYAKVEFETKFSKS